MLDYERPVRDHPRPRRPSCAAGNPAPQSCALSLATWWEIGIARTCTTFWPLAYGKPGCRARVATPEDAVLIIGRWRPLAGDHHLAALPRQR